MTEGDFTLALNVTRKAGILQSTAPRRARTRKANRGLLIRLRLWEKNMTIASLRRVAAIAVSSLALIAATRSFGPPWISIETPPNPFDPATRGAFLVVHTFHHREIVASPVSGTAEGIVSGARRSIRLAFDTTSRRGSYALRRQWPTDGTWMLVIRAGEGSGGVTALVDIGSAGTVSGVRVPTRRNGEWDIPQQVSAHEIDAALEERAARAVSARQ